MEITDIVSRQFTVENYRAAKSPWVFEELTSRFLDEADKAADLAEQTGRPLLECLPDPYMARGMLSSELPEGGN